MMKMLIMAVSLAVSGAFVPYASAQNVVAQEAYDILKKNCFSCHGASRTSGLDLRSAESLGKGGEHGRVIVPHDPNSSKLFLAVSQQAELKMPPGKKLSTEEISKLREWIEAGGSFDDVEEAKSAAVAAKTDQKIPERPITVEERAFWAFQPAKRTPATASIDAFISASLKSKGLKLSPKADRRTLIRRAYLDVLGLPPSPEEVDAFVADRSPDAWPRLVDKLLASPQYGERWARHWLDLVRYADSGGFEFDTDRPDGWRYRDYVVQAFNKDKPYDQFIREQIAGDEYSPISDDAMVATGFLRLGPESADGGERGRQDALDDIVATTALTFMGMTVQCARCHDHKFDPILQKDYYQMQAVFFSTRSASHPLVAADVVAAHKAETDRLDALLKPLRKTKSDLEAPYLKQIVDATIAQLPEYLQIAWRAPENERTPGQQLNVKQIQKTLENDSLRNKITEEHIVELMTADVKQKHAELKKQIADLEKQRPRPYPTARAIAEPGRDPRPSYFLFRGGVDAKGPVMSPGVLTILAGDYKFTDAPEDAKSSWRRRGFADWLASPQNPLTARVMVNRIWQHHFGEGIVRTPSNFGKMGERPSHPELLDWLAVEFVEHGWSIKHMHRLMMLSETYQMSSNDIAANVAIDPENRMFWRMPRQRLEAETIRDEILAVSGKLDRTIGGPGVFPYINPDLFEASSKRNWPGKPDDDPSTWRRSIYVHSKRSIRYPMFETFDQPNLINSVDRRNRSTVAPQALLLMNNAMVIQQSKYFAARVKGEAGNDLRAQVDRAYRLALGRAPSEFERTKAIDYIRTSADGLAEFCQALFNLNEFVYSQ